MIYIKFFTFNRVEYPIEITIDGDTVYFGMENIDIDGTTHQLNIGKILINENTMESEIDLIIRLIIKRIREIQKTQKINGETELERIGFSPKKK